MNLMRPLTRLIPSFVLFTLVACAGPDALEPEAPSSPSSPAVVEESPDDSRPVSQFARYVEICLVYACPAGSQEAGYPSCSQFCPGYSWQTGKCSGIYNARYCMFPATGSISASPTEVWVDTRVTQVGSTTICWDVDNASDGEVWLSMDGQSEVLFARAQDGCQSADWILAGHAYNFRLYEGTAHSNQLADVTVLGYGIK